MSPELTHYFYCGVDKRHSFHCEICLLQSVSFVTHNECGRVGGEVTCCGGALM